MSRRIKSAVFPIHRHSFPQLVVDGVLVALAYYLAYKLRFDRGVPLRYNRLLEATLAPAVICSLAIFVVSGLYQKWWRYLSAHDYGKVVRAALLATIALVGLIAIFHPVKIAARSGIVAVTPPAGVIAFYFLLLLVLLCGVRFLIHLLFEAPVRGFRAVRDARGVLIIGAGDGGQQVLREIIRNPQLGYRPLGFIDDDPRKLGMRFIGGIKVLGHTGELGRMLDDRSPDEVIIAIPSASGRWRSGVVSACRERNIPVRTLPTVFELLRGGGNLVGRVRELQIEDILGREPVRVELKKIGAYLSDRVVMVTGAGGSIGSELCRQIAHVGAKQLILVDHAEDNLFAIARELSEERHFGGINAVLADCKEEERMREVFLDLRPTVVFHAAAYKHVGLMEKNPVEAVRNNALSTRVMARVAGEFETKKFVLVSTDKAVNPATVMGASKALAEWAVEAAQARFPKTNFGSVRFGNVLGSSGSVVPIFRRQIAAGGPITVTDKRMKRYFLTIPEAVQLVIRAGSMASRGEVFALEMGESVSILELAHTMIKLSGLRPEEDIGIDIVGARPGEKFQEELFNDYETPRPTDAEKILLAQREPLDPDWVEASFDKINLLVLEGDASGLAKQVSALARGLSESSLGVV